MRGTNHTTHGGLHGSATAKRREEPCACVESRDGTRWWWCQTESKRDEKQKARDSHSNKEQGDLVLH